VNALACIDELQVHIGGYSEEVPQPALGGELRKAGDEALVLSEEELIAVGWRAHDLQQALSIEGVLCSGISSLHPLNRLHHD
jgi:hypothetical protein